jgi:hypothetical protein
MSDFFIGISTCVDVSADGDADVLAVARTACRDWQLPKEVRVDSSKEGATGQRQCRESAAVSA